MKDILFSVIELVISILIEGIILAGLFQWISTKAQTKQEQNLQEEMSNLEKQNKFDFEQLQAEIRATKQDILNEIKERT